ERGAGQRRFGQAAPRALVATGQPVAGGAADGTRPDADDRTRGPARHGRGQRARELRAEAGGEAADNPADDGRLPEGPRRAGTLLSLYTVDGLAGGTGRDTGDDPAEDETDAFGGQAERGAAGEEADAGGDRAQGRQPVVTVQLDVADRVAAGE